MLLTQKDKVHMLKQHIHMPKDTEQKRMLLLHIQKDIRLRQRQRQRIPKEAVLLHKAKGLMLKVREPIGRF